MGIGDKLENAADKVGGNIKGKVGDATDNPDLQAEGRAQETKGDLKQAGEKIKDAFKG